jgi:hypothetical protein
VIRRTEHILELSLVLRILRADHERQIWEHLSQGDNSSVGSHHVIDGEDTRLRLANIEVP